MTREEAERVAAVLVTMQRLGLNYVPIRVAGKEVDSASYTKDAERIASEWREAIVRALVGVG